jgi:hypothetical protein
VSVGGRTGRKRDDRPDRTGPGHVDPGHRDVRAVSGRGSSLSRSGRERDQRGEERAGRQDLPQTKRGHLTCLDAGSGRRCAAWRADPRLAAALRRILAPAADSTIMTRR